MIGFANQNFEVEEILYRWSAQDCTTMDNIPYIGNITPDYPDIYVATGFKKWGMTSSAVSAMVLRDLIVKNENPWAEVYDPSRFIDTTCTHMGCKLKWNGAERTWDCPCHGSRFSPAGNVIDGSAFKPLDRIEVN